MTGAVEEKPNLRRTSKISPTNIRVLRRILKQNRRANCGELSVAWNRTTGKHISKSTCLRDTKQLSYNFYKAKEKLLLTERQKKNRLIWVKNHQNLSQMQWDSVIWSYESRFEVYV